MFNSIKIYFIKKSNKPTIIFFRQRKIGGASIEHLLKKSGLHCRYSLDQDELPKTPFITIASSPKADPIQLYEKAYKLINQLENKISFTVVRDPYTKALSSYNYLRGRKHDMFKDETFEYCLLNRPPCQYGPEGHDYRHFTMTQTDWNYYKGNLIPDVVLKFESLNEEVDTFFKKNGYKLAKLEKRNSSKSYKIDFDPSEIELINEIYHDDFINFDYTKRTP
jgi:hypothetical protein